MFSFAPMEMTKLQMPENSNVSLNSHCSNYFSMGVLLTSSFLERVHSVAGNFKQNFMSIFKGFCLQIFC